MGKRAMFGSPTERAACTQAAQLRAKSEPCPPCPSCIEKGQSSGIIEEGQPYCYSCRYERYHDLGGRARGEAF